MNKMLIFRITSGFISIYHFLLGLCGTFASTETVTKIVKTVYKADVILTPQLAYIVKFISAYFIAFAIAMAVLAIKPIQYRNVLWVAVGLFSFRILDRILFMDTLKEAFGENFSADYFTLGTITVLLIILIVTRPKEQS